MTRTMREHTITANVGNREISWTFPNGNSGMRFWKQLRSWGACPDTGQRVYSADLIRCGQLIERYENPWTRFRSPP